MKLALKVTPQRSTQYATMALALAIPEVLASPIGAASQTITPLTLGNQHYLLLTFDDGLTPALGTILPVCGRLGTISEMYEYFDSLGEIEGPFLRPLDAGVAPFVPLEMAEIRRYKGKTNEVFTRVLLNLAIFAGAYSGQYAERLRVLDPLAGGGTTLFLALAAGYDAFGIEQDRQDVETTAVFIRQYLHGERISYKELAERRQHGSRRYQFSIRGNILVGLDEPAVGDGFGDDGGDVPRSHRPRLARVDATHGARNVRDETRLLVLAQGDTARADEHMRDVPGGSRVHAIVGDLPYGIQHFGEIAELLQGALPVWERLLLPGGALALAWNATRVRRAELVALVEHRTRLTIRDLPPYTQLAHAVDRVIKQRDVLVAVAPR